MSAPMSPWAILRRDRTARACGIVLTAIALLAILADALPFSDPGFVSTSRRYQAPSFSSVWEPAPRAASDVVGVWSVASRAIRLAVFGDYQIGPILGTDELGRCILSRTVFGSRLSLLAALAAACVTLLVGTAVGTWAGWKGGRIETTIMRCVDLADSVPVVFVVIFAVSFLRASGITNPSAKVAVFFLTLGAVTWITMARLVRAHARSLREQGFIESSVALGLTERRLVWKHLLPNLVPTMLVGMSLTIPRILLFESFLSFLGMGVESPDLSLGTLARSGFGAFNPIEPRAWLLAVPGISLAALLLALNLLGDSIRDAFDPRLPR